MENGVLIDRTARRPARGPLPGLGFVVRVLAVVDAVALQVVLLWWIWQWPDHHGSFVGTVLATVLLYYAIKRAARAVFAFDTYGWGFSRLLLAMLAMGFLMKLMFWGQRFF